MPSYYTPKEQFRIVPEVEIKQYIDSEKDVEMKLLLALAWLSGARISELIKVRAGNFAINDATRRLHFTRDTLKGGKKTEIVLSFDDAFVSDLIMPTVRDKPWEFRIFFRTKRSYQQHLLKLNKLLKPNSSEFWITFHYLRHSRITYIARILGATPEQIKSWTGHKSSAYETYFGVRMIEDFAGQLGKI